MKSFAQLSKLVGHDYDTIQRSADKLASVVVTFSKAPNQGSLCDALLQLLATANTMGLGGDELLILADQKMQINKLRQQ